MIETMIEQPISNARALKSLRKRGYFATFEHLPEPMAVRVAAVSGDQREVVLEIADQEGYMHTLKVPSMFAQELLLEHDEQAHTRIERVLRAEWN